MAGREAYEFASPTLVTNPFFIIGTTPWTTRGELFELAEQRASSIEESAITEAVKILSHPRLRVSAEIAWLPGVNEEATRRLLGHQSLDGNDLAAFDLPPLAGANVLSWIIERRTESHADREWLTHNVLLLLDFIEHIDLDATKAQVDDAREEAGFPATLLQQFSEALREQRRKLLRIANRALQTQELAQRAKILTAITQIRPKSSSVDDVIDTFELDADHRIQGLSQSILNLFGLAQSQYTAPIDQVRLADASRQLSEYATIIRPLLITYVERGKKHPLTERIYVSLRNFAIDPANNRLWVQQRIVLLSSLLGVVKSIAEYRRTLEQDIADWEKRKLPIANLSPQPSPIYAKAENIPHAAPTFNPPRAVPAPTLPPIRPERPSKLSTSARWVIAILVGIGIIAAFGKGHSSNNSASQHQSSSIVQTPTPKVDPCSDIDAWWNATQDRVLRSNAIVNSIDQYSSLYDRQIAQQKISGIASMQQFSSPPPVAVLYNIAETNLFYFIAQDLVDTTSTQYMSQQRFSTLSEDAKVKRSEVASNCNFTLTEQ